jgi:acyl-coenzyme A synthetase/AMP-(fatty) acid ligase
LGEYLPTVIAAAGSGAHRTDGTFAVPRDVIFVNALPRNATGKVLRRNLAGQ